MIRLDWREYFLRFCERHGKPVKVGGRLVFADGWGYALDYRGPEFKPPDDLTENWALKLAYWRERKKAARIERDKLIGWIEIHARTQLTRDGELQQAGIEEVTGEDGQRRLRYSPRPVNWDDLKLRVQMLDDELLQCEREVNTLEGL